MPASHSDCAAETASTVYPQSKTSQPALTSPSHCPFDAVEVPMRNATELMVQYAAYHRDRRNITTHYVGIPLIVFAIGVLLARPGFEVNNLALTSAWCCSSSATITRGASPRSSTT